MQDRDLICNVATVTLMSSTFRHACPTTHASWSTILPSFLQFGCSCCDPSKLRKAHNDHPHPRLHRKRDNFVVISIYAHLSNALFLMFLFHIINLHILTRLHRRSISASTPASAASTSVTSVPFGTNHSAFTHAHARPHDAMTMCSISITPSYFLFFRL